MCPVLHPCPSCNGLYVDEFMGTGMCKQCEAIHKFIDVCTSEQRELSDVEFEAARKLDWFLTCPDKKCGYYQRDGKAFSANLHPCIECQTEPEED